MFQQTKYISAGKILNSRYTVLPTWPSIIIRISSFIDFYKNTYEPTTLWDSEA